MVTTTSGSVVATAGETLPISSLFTITGNASSLLLLLSDDAFYSADQPGTYGYLSGDGQALKLGSAAGANIYNYAVFTYDAATGAYSNSLLGNLAGVSYVALSGSGHNETLSLVAPNDAPVSLSITTGSAHEALSNATPEAICSIAQSIAGEVWNDNSCWLLASVISARAGASLPLSSDDLSPPGNPTIPRNNGEWIAVYDGETQANPTFAGAEALLRPGDVVDLTWAGGYNGHVATVVSGFGAAAQVIDDWNFGSNVVQDGTGVDITIHAAHSLDDELTGKAQNPVPGGPIPASIQIYRLDTPTITALNQATIDGHQTISLSPLFVTQDAGGEGSRPITDYAFYDTDGAFISNGAATLAHNADQKIIVSAEAMPSLELQGPVTGSDIVYVSAYNGQYWGDWAALTVTVTDTLSDSAADIQASLDQLEPLVAANTVRAITLTDGGTPDITVTAAQFAADSAVLKAISSAHSVTVEVSGDAAQHDFSADHWAGATALQFADQTVIVAATPGPANAVTTGNITELYAAVFSREPDVGGLAFYQNFLKSNPGAPLLTFADYFLNSTEYQNNTAHDYAQTIAGDTQFIEDSYQNLLHRTPSAGEVSFYLTNVMNKPDAHALMLVYFSASAEFLGNVQITAQNAASAQHWLLLT